MAIRRSDIIDFLLGEGTAEKAKEIDRELQSEPDGEVAQTLRSIIQRVRRTLDFEADDETREQDIERSGPQSP